MTKEQIIFSVIMPMLIALLSSFSKSIFDKIFAEYKPDRKKLISYVRKFFLFSLRYGLPVFMLTYSFIFENLSKLFVFKISLFVSVITLSFIIDLYHRVIAEIVSVQKEIIESLRDMNNKR